MNANKFDENRKGIWRSWNKQEYSYLYGKTWRCQESKVETYSWHPSEPLPNEPISNSGRIEESVNSNFYKFRVTFWRVHYFVLFKLELSVLKQLSFVKCWPKVMDGTGVSVRLLKLGTVVMGQYCYFSRRKRNELTYGNVKSDGAHIFYKRPFVWRRMCVRPARWNIYELLAQQEQIRTRDASRKPDHRRLLAHHWFNTTTELSLSN